MEGAARGAARDGPGGRPAPRTARGRATRGRVLDAARAVFERDGWSGASVPRIAAAAGVAHGTFYTYFDSKEDVLEAVLADLWDDIYAGDLGGAPVPLLGAEPTAAEARVVVARANARYLDAYRRNATLMALVEQLSTEPARLARFDVRRQQFVERAARFVRRLQAAGLTPPELDAHTTAAALVAMMRHFAYTWFVRGDAFDPEVARRTLDEVWVRTLCLDGG